MVQRLRLHTSNAVGEGSIPGQGTRVPHATWCGQKNKKLKKLKKKKRNVKSLEKLPFKKLPDNVNNRHIPEL